jgi:CheY-like chemotaxis protein
MQTFISDEVTVTHPWIRVCTHLHTPPISALTAKAMKGDPEKCQEAGASDFVQSINSGQLLSLLRMWLHR